MNAFSAYRRRSDIPDPLGDPLDALLIGIAINVQLPPGLFETACSRYGAVQRHLERHGSPLEGRVVQLYPQGSMAIDATISTRGTDDEYDLDIVAELDLPPDARPGDVLDTLWEALRDYPVQEVIRQTRCVTLVYSDKMHIDVTPARRMSHTRDFESVIFHAHPDEPAHRHALIPMNAFGFAGWFNERTPEEELFSLAFDQRLQETFDSAVKADAIVHEVPRQTVLPRKNAATVALQIIKRFRNVWSVDKPGRYPPSVMLSCHAGQAASPGMPLSDMVIRQARWTARAIDTAARMGRLLDVRNPVLNTDKFTDRWPENHGQQRDFAAALLDLADGLERVRNGSGAELEDLQDWLRDRFGQRVVTRAVEGFVGRNGRAIRGSSQLYTPKGNLYVPSAPAIIGATAAAVSPVRARPHTNMGERR